MSHIEGETRGKGGRKPQTIEYPLSLKTDTILDILYKKTRTGKKRS